MFMDVTISTDLHNIYKDSHKNLDMALMTLLDSLDPKAFQKAFDILNPISLTGDTIKIKIGDAATDQIRDTFGSKDIDNDLVNLLLWIGVLFPEI